MINPWVILAVVMAVLSAFGGGYYKGDEAGRAEIQQKWDKEKAQQLAEYAKAQEESRAKERELQANADKLRQEKDRDQREATARIAALVNSLRDRPARPAEASSVSSSASTGSTPAGCTGAGLYRPDGEFLAGEAAAARQCQTLLKQCRNQYKVAEELIK